MAKKDYQNWEREKLLHEYKELLKRKKFGVVWEDKPEDVAEQCKTLLPVLKDEKKKNISSQNEKPTHIMIQGDNYHALSVLNYTHKRKVDVIYIDPPYNTGAKDWKYNNDYVDVNDRYRHSKWLSFMGKRLRLARSLLKRNGVLIVTIDEHEVHHLGMLLEEIFPDAYRQMVTIVINPKGVTQGRFARVEEYAFFVFLGNSSVESIGDDLLTPISEDDNGSDKPRWKGLLRSGTNARREDRKNLFYPVLIDEKRGSVVGAGEVLPYPKEPNLSKKVNGYTAAWPIRTDGTWGNWGVSNVTLRTLIEKGYVGVGGFDSVRKTWGISYLSRTAQDQLAAGLLEIVSYDKKKNLVEVRWTGEAPRSVKTVWHRSKHDAGAYGTDHLRKILGSRAFSFPKSIYSVMDCLSVVVKNNPDAVILDFFAGSGTTGEAVLRINEEFPGQRSFILCTNNENGIATDVCYPRIKKVMQGYSKKGEEVKGLDGNLKYFITDFVDNVKTDNDKRVFTLRSTEMLCLAENTFHEIVSKKEAFAIYENSQQMTGIIYDEDEISNFKKEAKKYKKPFVIYVFSYDHTYNEEDFEDLKNLQTVKPIPEVILNVYRKIYKEIYKPRHL